MAQNKKKIAIILGTRPEIIKMFPVILVCQKKKLDYFILHTGQHYDYEIDKIFFEEFNCPKPKYNPNIGSATCTDTEQIGAMLPKIEQILRREKATICLVQGDTNTVLAGALASSRMNVPIGHIEAGLRSFDRTMPEEVDRVVADHLSDFLFAPTEQAKKNLIEEGIDESKIFVTGNTIVDTVFKFRSSAQKRSQILKKLNLQKNKYFLATIHRQENVDSMPNFNNILTAFSKLSEFKDMPIIYPIHPRSKKRLREMKITLPKNVVAIDPVGFFDFLNLEMNAALIFTDSGGVQEEACILRTPCLTLRENTERPETVTVGANIICGRNPKNILAIARKCLKSPRNWENPFGDGHAGEKIINKLQKLCGF